MLEEETRVSPKASMRAVQTEKLRQLRAGEKKRDTAFESGHDALRNEMDHHSGLREPRNEGDERDEQRRAGRERAKAHRIAAVNLAKRRTDDQRDGGCNGNGGVARTAKDPEDKAAEQTSIKACFWR